MAYKYSRACLRGGVSECANPPPKKKIRFKKKNKGKEVKRKR